MMEFEEYADEEYVEFFKQRGVQIKKPPTSLTEDEQAAREQFDKRLNFVHDLRTAEEFLKFHWMHTEVSPVPLEIKYHILEDDPITARHEFEARSVFLEYQHSPEEGRTFKAYGHRHESTTQHFAELAFGHGTVKYVVVWIEKDQTQKEES
jgi:hypothetical protein